MFQIKNIFLEGYFLFQRHVKDISFYYFFPKLFLMHKQHNHG